MTCRHGLIPRTLLVHTFLLVSLLLFFSASIWLTLFGLAEREPRARQLAQLTVSVANLTKAALLSADPVKRLRLLQDIAESEGIRLYPAEPDDATENLPDTYFFRIMDKKARAQLGTNTRFAGTVNGQKGLWVSFCVGDGEEDDYWLMLPGEHAQSDFAWHWLGWGCASMALALLVTWLIVSRVTRPLRVLAESAKEIGSGRHPEPIAETGTIELRQLAEAFNRMSEDLKRTASERAEILAGISHDLRTPLTRLRLESEMSIHDDEARASVIGDIEQMDAIIAQFLDYARDDSAETPEITDINALIKQRIGTEKRGSKTLTQTLLGPIPPTRIHPKAFQRALSNLIVNAQKYAGDELAIQSGLIDDEIFVAVLDRGPGIPESEIERLKRPFTRLENARTDAHGTGLGLAIVERIAHLHDGQLELLPRDGGGLIARLRFPIAKKDSSHD